MNRLEPNLLLAVATGIALALLVMTASVYGEPGGAVKYPIMAVVCAGLFVVLNSVLMRRLRRETPPMIHHAAPQTAIWAALFPLMVILAAGVPVFFPGHDYGLLIIIAAIWFGVTVESALKGRSR